MCTAYAVRQHRLSVLVKVFSRSRARTGAAGSARSRPERSAAPAASTERSTTRAVAARSRPIRRPGGLRLEVGQTRSCIPRSDAPGRTSGSRRIHVPHDRRPTAPTSSTPSQHAARRASRARRAGCRIGLSAARHTATLAAWSPAVNRAMNRYQRSPKICEYATEYRDVSVPGSPVRSPEFTDGDPAVRVWSGSRSRDPSPPRRTGVTVHRTRTTVDATVYSPHNPHVNASGCS